MDLRKIEDPKSGDTTPFTKFCLNSLPALSNFSARAEDAAGIEAGEMISKEEEKAPKVNTPCGCSRTKCLKLYCECFSNNRFCIDCHCKNCKNRPEFEEIRNKAKISTIERNPTAFRQEIISTYKACNCKRSSCKKKYCECFESNRSCTANCKCEGCQNLPLNNQ